MVDIHVRLYVIRGSVRGILSGHFPNIAPGHGMCRFCRLNQGQSDGKDIKFFSLTITVYVMYGILTKEK